MIATYPPNSQTVKYFPHSPPLPVSFPSVPSTPSTIVSTLPSAAGQSPLSLSKGKAVLEYDIGTENINPNKQFKRQIDSESLRNVLKRCRSNAHSTQLASSAPTSTSTLPVADLIDQHRQWDITAISANFGPADFDRILAIPLSLYPTEDILIWNGTTSG
ncbi:hypothetical protein G4B88_022940 [Cannabis sativa]|uniref:Uncharacterized protein n=1 Tax=Cannabis sativa TaxID=3483 RepID=A0A7J6G5K2_CANSA|nr:hypothetical protein G4B88_022940 [Cannabis sativa]